MLRSGVVRMLISAIYLTAICAIGWAAQTQSDPQAGAQLERSALAGKQAQGENTQKATDSAPAAGSSLSVGTAINAELTGSLDSKKVKTGDAVNARTIEAVKSEGNTLLPKGTKLAGHVTQASARGAGQADSSLGLVFDKAILKNGQQIQLNVAIEALGAPPTAADVNQNPDVAPVSGTAPGTGRGTMSGAESRAAGTLNRTAGPAGGAVDSTVNSTAGVTGNTAGDLNGAGQLNTNSRGLFGLNNLSLSATGGDGTQGSVITSTGKNVHLDSGTRLILVSQASTSSQPVQENPPASERKPEQKP